MFCHCPFNSIVQTGDIRAAMIIIFYRWEEILMAGRRFTILMADDDADDRMFVREAFAGKPVEVKFVGDGLELLDYLRCQGKYKENRNGHP